MQRPRATFANVVSCLALFVALGGTGYAAISLPRNSVGPRQLQAHSIDNSKIKKGSLLKSAFKQGQLPRGLRGKPGAAGQPGRRARASRSRRPCRPGRPNTATTACTASGAALSAESSASASRSPRASQPRTPTSSHRSSSRRSARPSSRPRRASSACTRRMRPTRPSQASSGRTGRPSRAHRTSASRSTSRPPAPGPRTPSANRPSPRLDDLLALDHEHRPRRSASRTSARHLCAAWRATPTTRRCPGAAYRRQAVERMRGPADEHAVAVAEELEVVVGGARVRLPPQQRRLAHDAPAAGPEGNQRGQRDDLPGGARVVAAVVVGVQRDVRVGVPTQLEGGGRARPR